MRVGRDNGPDSEYLRTVSACCCWSRKYNFCRRACPIEGLSLTPGSIGRVHDRMWLEENICSIGAVETRKQQQVARVVSLTVACELQQCALASVVSISSMFQRNSSWA